MLLKSQAAGCAHCTFEIAMKNSCHSKQTDFQSVVPPCKDPWSDHRADVRSSGCIVHTDAG